MWKIKCERPPSLGCLIEITFHANNLISVKILFPSSYRYLKFTWLSCELLWKTGGFARMTITGSCIKQAESCKPTPLETAPLCQGVPCVGNQSPALEPAWHLSNLSQGGEGKKKVDLMINNNALSPTLKDIIGSLLHGVNQGNVWIL